MKILFAKVVFPFHILKLLWSANAFYLFIFGQFQTIAGGEKPVADEEDEGQTEAPDSSQLARRGALVPSKMDEEEEDDMVLEPSGGVGSTGIRRKGSCEASCSSGGSNSNAASSRQVQGDTT